MLPQALPQLVDTLMRLPQLETAELREMIQQLPDPQASAQEMVDRGWITPDQFSLLFPAAQPRPTASSRETMVAGFGGDETMLDADGDDWNLPLTHDEPELWTKAPPPPPKTPRVFVGLKVGERESDMDEGLRKLMSWAGKGLLVAIFVFGSFFAGLQLFAANSTVPPAARQESRDADAGDPAASVVMVNSERAKVRDVLPKTDDPATS